MSPMTIALGIMLLTMSKQKLLIQYVKRSSPLISYICLTFFSLSLRIKLITAAGIKAKPIDTTNTMKIPLDYAALNLSFYVIGKADVTVSNLKLGFPDACLRIASYKNYG